ncbi:MAG: hypothetical protein RR053_03930 [Evtepia sp.]
MKSKPMERITGDASLKRYFNSEYIGAYSLDPGVEPILTIDSLWYGDVVLGGGRSEEHVIVRFKEKAVHGVAEVKPLILNATNRKTLKKVYGVDSACALEGKQIQLFIDPKVRDPDGGGFTEGLRIRPFKPRPQAATVPLPACTDCKEEITECNGKPPAYMVAYTVKHYGVPLCALCATRRKNMAEVTDCDRPPECEEIADVNE